jgi:FG-GAP-like repeat
MNRSPLFHLTALAVFCFYRVAAGAPEHPIVEMETGFLIGAQSDGKWLDGAHAAKTFQPGTSFRVYSLVAEVGVAIGSNPKSADEPCPEAQVVPFSSKPKEGVIALAASWNALPRKPRVTDTTQPVYEQAIRDFLRGRGIKEPKVKITQIIRIDLDGDGEDEVLISATNYSTDDGVPSRAPAGSYSFVLLRRVAAGKVKTQLVAGEFYTKATGFSAPNSYRVLSVLDLDGDGKMEVIVESNYYEGGATTIYRWTPAKIEELLSVACGA